MNFEATLTQLKDFSRERHPEVSFEFFPPKTSEMEQNLWASIEKLEPLQPRFVSVTYGAGGSTRERTHATVKRILDETSLTPAAHLTCVGATREEVNEVAQDYWDSGVKHIVALRGDMPGNEAYSPFPGGYQYADDLVYGLKKIADFEISVAAYPETHPEARSADDDIDHLKRKVDAGADRAITQYFFEADNYLRFVERAQARGVDVPIVPGILPVTNFAQAKKFSVMCGTAIPRWMVDLYEGLDAFPHTREMVSAIVAVEQCRLLSTAGVDEFHFYTLNRSELTIAICHILGLRLKDT